MQRRKPNGKAPEVAESGKLVMVPVSQINAPDLPVRETMDEQNLLDLEESLKSVGQLYPLLVKPADGRYEIVDGHRRFLAISRAA